MVPDSNIQVTVRAANPIAPRMNRLAIDNLMLTGRVAIDLLAARAGGFDADLNAPRFGWAISGLAIQTSDATQRHPRDRLTAGGPFRFDELKAAYQGIQLALFEIGDVECNFHVWRVSNIIRRRVKFLGYGYVKHAAMLGTGGDGSMIVAGPEREEAVE